MAVDSNQVTEKWARAMSSAGQAYTEGVRKVRTSPMEKAAEKAGAYTAGVQEAVRTGKWQRGLRKVSLQEWQNKAANVGGARLAQGAQAAQDKVRDFWREWSPELERAQQEVDSMPGDTFEQRTQKALAMMQKLHNAGARRKGGNE